MAQYTGFSESKVNDLMSEFNRDSENLLEELTRQFNNVIEALADNWGTQDAIQHVEEKIIPGFTTTGQQISQVVQSIGQTIKSVAEAQARDTNNSVSISAPEAASLGTITNKMQSQLSNGFVGVYTELETEVKEAAQNLGEEVSAKLDKLKANLVENASEAFTDAGTSKVSTEADGAIATIQTKITETLTQLQTDVNTIAKNANQYAKDIQNAGLRQSTAG